MFGSVAWLGRLVEVQSVWRLVPAWLGRLIGLICGWVGVLIGRFFGMVGIYNCLIELIWSVFVIVG